MYFVDKKSKLTSLTCIQCGFQARDSSELSRHHLVHSLNRPYACTRCGFSTKYQDELAKHLRKYHPEISSEEVSREMQARMSPGNILDIIP